MKRRGAWKRRTGLILGVVCACLSLRLWYPPEAAEEDRITTFLRQHWQVPIPLQGRPPDSFSAVEASLHPKDCGGCHVKQYEDWQTSRHSRSMGPGVYGQLLDMDAATVTVCATCHTPLSEQIPHRLQHRAYVANQAFDGHLQQAGLVCAACHVRQHQRFGPPRRPERPLPAPGTLLPHDGFTASPAFQQSAFCKGCHQFDPDGFAINGKLLENTYEEWRQSPYADAGVQCQTCHMPDRRHLWRGIHDPEMVRKALTVDVHPTASTYRPGDRLEVVITMTNRGAGHYVPTYVTPQIVLQSQLLDAQGQTIHGTTQQSIVGREIALDLSAEWYDTRIPPNGSHVFTYVQNIPPAAAHLQVRVVVHPDRFYQRFFAALLEEGGGGKGRSYLAEALRITQSSSFAVFTYTRPLDKATSRP